MFVFQAVMECVVNPPREGDVSYEQFMSEKKAVLSSLAQRAKMVVETFNSVPGMSCNIVQGAMYAFPQVSETERQREREILVFAGNVVSNFTIEYKVNIFHICSVLQR